MELVVLMQRGPNKSRIAVFVRQPELPFQPTESVVQVLDENAVDCWAGRLLSTNVGIAHGIQQLLIDILPDLSCSP